MLLTAGLTFTSGPFLCADGIHFRHARNHGRGLTAGVGTKQGAQDSADSQRAIAWKSSSAVAARATALRKSSMFISLLIFARA